MTNLLALTRAATEQRGTTRVLGGIEVAHTINGPTVSAAVACTDSLRDLRRSLQIGSARLHGLRCHGGYLAAARLIHAHLSPIVRRGEVRLAGHSLGGAVARLTGRLFQLDGIRVTWIETYGEPASQGTDLAAIPQAGCRYVCGSDPVPYWAPSYVHTGKARKVPSCSRWWPGRGFLDHSLSSYERQIVERAP